MIRRPTGCFRFHPAKAKLAQIEFLNKNVNHANGIVLTNPVLQASGNSVPCPRSVPSTKRLIHLSANRARIISRNQMNRRVFTQPESRRIGDTEAALPNKASPFGRAVMLARDILLLTILRIASAFSQLT